MPQQIVENWLAHPDCRGGPFFAIFGGSILDLVWNENGRTLAFFVTVKQ